MAVDRLVGIMSDTHDDRGAIRSAVAAFNRAGCGLVLHAGDVIAPFTIVEFENLNAPFIGVFGNNDGERKGLAARFAVIGSLFAPPHEFTYRGKRFLLMHEPYTLEDSLGRTDLDVVVYGHTHAIDIRPGRPLAINPGECCSWLTGRSTVVLLDLGTMGTEVIDLVP